MRGEKYTWNQFSSFVVAFTATRRTNVKEITLASDAANARLHDVTGQHRSGGSDSIRLA